MSILFVITSSHIGGTEKFLYNLATHLAHLDMVRFKPVVCSLKKPGFFAQCLKEKGIPVYSLNMPEKTTSLTPFLCLFGFFRLVYLIKRGKFVLIHSFLYRANILSRIAGALAGVSFIISSERCLTRNKHPLAVWLDRWTSPLSRYVMANSEAVAQQLRKRERVKPDKIRVIYSGIDKTAGNLVLSREKRAEIKSFLNLSPSDYIIGCVARLHSDKGLDDLLKACALADKSFSGFSLLLVGDGPEKEHLESLAKDLGLTEKIRFTGFYHEVETIIQLFDLFVLPSLEESFPLSVLEAMSFGLPVIATAVGGVPEMVAANETGILVPPHHPEILANKILELIRNPDLAKKMGQAGKVRVENHFSFSNCLSQIEGLYKDALKNFDYQCNMER